MNGWARIAGWAALTALLAACGSPVLDRFRKKPDAAATTVDGIAVLSPGADTIRPRPRGSVGAATPAGGEVRLGETIGGLGDPARPGLWVQTPLVTSERPGRVVWKDNGNAISVTLLPKDPASGPGSLVSLEAMRALGLPLTGLATLIVHGS